MTENCSVSPRVIRPVLGETVRYGGTLTVIVAFANESGISPSLSSDEALTKEIDVPALDAGIFAVNARYTSRPVSLKAVEPLPAIRTFPVEYAFPSAYVHADVIVPVVTTESNVR